MCSPRYINESCICCGYLLRNLLTLEDRAVLCDLVVPAEEMEPCKVGKKSVLEGQEALEKESHVQLRRSSRHLKKKHY